MKVASPVIDYVGLLKDLRSAHCVHSQGGYSSNHHPLLNHGVAKPETDAKCQ